jgi:phage baseplate assembly protein gpV
MTDQQQGFAGQNGLRAQASEYDAIASIVEQLMGRAAFVKLVKIVAVSPGNDDGQVAVAGTVDVLPLVNLVDGLGNATKQATVHGLIYLRVQGGTNAVIMDPQVGDVGVAVVCDRDISSVKETKEQANPGSRRRFSIADGVYIGGVLCAAPEQYIRFHSGGVQVVSPAKVEAKVGSSTISLTESEARAEVGSSHVSLEASAAEVSVGTALVSLAPASAKLQLGANNVTVDATAIYLNGPVIFNGVSSGPGGGAVDFGSSEIKTTGPATLGSANVSGAVTAASVTGGGKVLQTHTHVAPAGGGPTSPPS